MIRGILIFIILWAIFLGLFSTWRTWTPAGAWKLSKAITFAGISATTAIIILAVIVYVF